jgi:hypothetical protein
MANEIKSETLNKKNNTKKKTKKQKNKKKKSKKTAPKDERGGRNTGRRVQPQVHFVPTTNTNWPNMRTMPARRAPTTLKIVLTGGIDTVRH